LKPDWEQWQGETVDSQYRLESLLGSSRTAAVFLTSIGSRPAAIKIVLAPNEELAKLTARWSRAAAFHHPNLLKILASGSWTKANVSHGYVVTEYAEENLATVLAERALSPEEIFEMLRPISRVLVFLHDRGLALGSLKPSNVFAVQEVLKISSDAIAPADPRLDLHALAGTVTEALTRNPGEPNSLPEPFQEMVRRCLGSDGRSQWTAADLATWLSSQQGGQPALSNAPSQRSRVRVKPTPAAMFILLAAILIVAVSIGAVFRSRGTAKPAAAPEAVAKSQPTAVPVPAQSHPAEISGATPSRPPSPAPPHPRAAIEIDQVLRQVPPEIPPKALRTIHGKATVVVKVVVDPSGEVIRASEQSGSRYFGRLAAEAARKWRFNRSNARPREFFLKFEITRTGTRAFVQKTASR
jgi:TonB family protein